MNVDGFARLLTDYCLEVQPGQQVAIASSTLAAPLLLALQREVLERGAWPLLDVTLPGQSESFWRSIARRPARRRPLGRGRGDARDRRDAAHRGDRERERARLGRPGADGALGARAGAAARGADDASAGRSRCGRRPAAAQQAGMGTRELEEFVERALFLDRDDPVAAWGELRAFQAGLIERLAPAREIHIEGPGTDLRLNVEGRTWVNSDGKRNMPSGEVFTGPHETSAEGVIRFTIPTAPRGVVVEDVTLEFREGKVVNAKAERGDAYLQATLETDAGARYLGELGIGTNFGIDRPIGAILFDEKIGGTVHLAIGRSYPETGGTNESVVHWDMICDLRQGGTLSVDGEVMLGERALPGLAPRRAERVEPLAGALHRGRHLAQRVLGGRAQELAQVVDLLELGRGLGAGVAEVHADRVHRRAEHRVARACRRRPTGSGPVPAWAAAATTGRPTAPTSGRSAAGTP